MTTTVTGFDDLGREEAPTPARAGPASADPAIARVLGGLDDAIARMMREARENAGMTQEEMSEYFGHERQWWNRIERSVRRMYLSDFLLAVRLLSEGANGPKGLGTTPLPPDHPAVALSRLIRRRARQP